MTKQGFTISEKQAFLEKIINDLKNEKYLKVSNDEIKNRFKNYSVHLSSRDIAKLKLREQLIKNSIAPSNLKEKEKEHFINQYIDYLKSENIKNISNADFIKQMDEMYGVAIREMDMSRLGIRKKLVESGIQTTFIQNSTAKPIIEQTITYLLANKISIDTVAQFHKYAEKFGKISRGSVDNYASYIQEKIEIKNIKSSKRLNSINISDEEIIVLAAKYFIKKNVYRITASEIRKFTNERYRTVDIQTIREYAVFLKNNYDIELIKHNVDDEKIKHDIEAVVSFLKENKNKYSVIEEDSIDNINDISDAFIVTKSLANELAELWSVYIDGYIKHLAKERINVKNGLLDSSGKFKIDTEKKELITLSHVKVSISDMNFSNIVQLTLIRSKASEKTYGIHLQNMYIGFLFFLYAENKIILPFSYLFDVCYADRKVQVELPYYLSDHPINKSLLVAIEENRLNVKDDKYKRIFQFCLLSLPQNFFISKIEYKHLVPLLDRNKKDFKRVVDILNVLGAHIVDEKPKLKYVDRYIAYSKKEKYKKLIDFFNKAMNRAYKLGSYAKEENVYKKWSIAYADFIDFIESYYSNENITESFLYKIFDYPDEEQHMTYQEYVQGLEVSSSTKDNKFTPLIVAFSDASMYRSLNNLKDKKPIFDNTSANLDMKKKRGPIKNLLALEKIEDILLNRPPKSDYHKKLKIESSHTDWWPHYHTVVPFEPLILLMHLYIPARGINFRLADRNSFLVKDEVGNVTGYHFTHDKNKKRKTPYIAPNIWGDDLKIIESLIEYSKIHFKNQRPIKYDKQNPQGIVPLFPNANGSSFYAEEQHMKYWKRVLLKAQIELNNEEQKEKIELIIGKTNEVVFPKNSFEVDNLSQTDMENFILKYDLHSLRHTGATKYANANMPLGLLKLLTGHIDLNTLQMVYIEVDVERVLKLWSEIQNININGTSLADAGRIMIDTIKTTTKAILLESNSEKMVEYLKQHKFLSIGSYLGKNELTKYAIEDFSKIDSVFWNHERMGICTSSKCPDGLEKRCSLCPHFMTSPAYIHEITAQINLQKYRLGKYANMVIENRENGNPENNESIRASAQIEIEEMLGWTEILKALDEIRFENNVQQNDESEPGLVDLSHKQEALYRSAPTRNSDHALLKLVYDSLDLKLYDHESMQDASQELATKLIRYASRNGKFAEVDDKDKYEMIEWFRPVYDEVLLLEKNQHSEEKLFNILSHLGDKSAINILEHHATKELAHKDKQ